MSAPGAHEARPSAAGILASLDARTRLDTLHPGPEPAEDVEPVWETPVPLAGHGRLPAFPVGALPGWVADQVAAVAEETQTPPDLAGCTALAALSAAAGGRAEVEVRGNWREPVNLFTVVVLPPGSRKSAVFSAMVRPLLAAERALIDAARPLIVEAELHARIAGKAAEKAAQAAAAATSPEARHDLMADATARLLDADDLTVPVLPRLVADDVTSEAAASLLAEQGGRLAVLSAEGGIFATLAGRYSATPNLEVFLKGHAGDLLRVDRKGRAAEHIDRPALTLGLAVQPEVLRDLAGMPGFRGRGLLARILFSLPHNTVGHRRIDTTPVPAEVTDAYTRNLTALVVTLADWTDPAVLPLTPDARARVRDLLAVVEPRLGPGGAWAHVVDWGSKYTGAVVRIAALLHLAAHLTDGWGRPIDADTLHNAAALGEYFAAHALAAFDDMGADPVTGDARYLLDWLTRRGLASFTRRELFTGTPRGRFPKVTALDPPLHLLEQHGYLRIAPAQDRVGATGRPPSPTWLVHPAHAHPQDGAR